MILILIVAAVLLRMILIIARRGRVTNCDNPRRSGGALLDAGGRGRPFRFCCGSAWRSAAHTVARAGKPRSTRPVAKVAQRLWDPVRRRAMIPSTAEPVDLYHLPLMLSRSHAFLTATAAGIAAGCAAGAFALAPVDGNRAGTAAGFAFFATMAAAAGALTIATAADGLTAARRR